MLKEIYGMGDDFTKEIDQSIRKRCKKPQDIQTYMIQFSAFSQDLLMLTGNLMKFKAPSAWLPEEGAVYDD